MSAVRFCAALAAVAFAAGATGQDKKADNKLPDEVVKILEKATELEVYSLAGTLAKGDDAAWNRWKVLGKTTVKKDEVRKGLVTAAKKGVEEGGQPAKCFKPRHGISATHDGKTVELIICFECGRIHVNAAAGDESLTISGTPEKALNDILTAAKVTLDKPGK